MITLKCELCEKIFKREYQKPAVKIFCSTKCVAKSRSLGRITAKCFLCSKTFIRKPSKIIRSEKQYCSLSCAATMNNRERKSGRRSKCEKMLYSLLCEAFPNLGIINNDRKTIDYELDIYIPSLKLAIEWNGIVHFKPIYGLDRLKEVKKRDREKEKLCKKHGINLITIPDLVSSSKIVYQAFDEIVRILADNYGISSNIR